MTGWTQAAYQASRRSQRDRLDREFWTHYVVDGECWIWTGFVVGDRGGYGRVKVNGRQIGAHRRAYELAYGPVPEGMLVLHSCDRPPCINPAHLRAGTSADNHTDMVERDRSTFGSRNPAAKLTEETVRAIRAEATHSTESNVSLAHRFGCSRQTVDRVLNGESWTRVA